MMFAFNPTETFGAMPKYNTLSSFDLQLDQKAVFPPEPNAEMELQFLNQSEFAPVDVIDMDVFLERPINVYVPNIVDFTYATPEVHTVRLDETSVSVQHVDGLENTMEIQNIVDGSDCSTSENTDPPDEKTVAAVLASLETNSMTPLIKEGLRSTIQNKRLQEGKEELQVKFVPYIRQKPHTEAEIVRAETRKVQNKLAARRFRQREKDVRDKLTKIIQGLNSTNSGLRAEIRELNKTVLELQGILQNHVAVCPKYQPCAFS